MAKRYTQEKHSHYKCRCKDGYCLQQFVHDLCGAWYDCDEDCPTMKLANRLAVYEDKYGVIEDE